MMLEFTHKNVIGELNSLLNISTSFGRGRAWLYHALNDNLMESYLRCMLENRRLVDRFYKKNASLLSDDQVSHTISFTLFFLKAILNVHDTYTGDRHSLHAHVRSRERLVQTQQRM